MEIKKEELVAKIEELEKQRTELTNQVNRMFGEITGQIAVYQQLREKAEGEEK